MPQTYFYFLTSGKHLGSCLLHKKGCEKLDDAEERIFLGSAYSWIHAREIVIKVLKKSVEHCPSCIPLVQESITD